MISTGGEASELAIVLSNLDLANAVQLLLKGDASSPIRCVVADFVADDGVMNAKTLIADTGTENIQGSGSVDFKKEQYDLQLKASSKKPSLVALRGPIVVTVLSSTLSSGLRSDRLRCVSAPRSRWVSCSRQWPRCFR